MIEDRKLSFVKRTKIIAITEEYRNREDAQGGSGLYPREIVLAESEEIIAFSDLPQNLSTR